MPGAGLEPARPCGQSILSARRLPIPPPGRVGGKGSRSVALLTATGRSATVGFLPLPERGLCPPGLPPPPGGRPVVHASGRGMSLIRGSLGARSPAQGARAPGDQPEEPSNPSARPRPLPPRRPRRREFHAWLNPRVAKGTSRKSTAKSAAVRSRAVERGGGATDLPFVRPSLLRLAGAPIRDPSSSRIHSVVARRGNREARRSDRSPGLARRQCGWRDSNPQGTKPTAS